jgi:hypothetical protein
MSKIVVATLLCDRKRASELIGLPAMLALEPPDGAEIVHYINYETHHADMWGASRTMLVRSGREYGCDSWQRASSWLPAPHFDQDQTRLEPICVARNMARAYALSIGASHLLFIDADVIVKPDGLRRLIALNRPLVGGLVPGRGPHNGRAQYAFGERWRRDNIINCAHGTCGYMLIAREVFGILPFRWGINRDDTNGGYQSEDPLYCNDAVHLLGERGEFWIDTGADAEHWDNPARPLRDSEAINDYYT